MSKMRCKQCGANEDRINGFCSVECEEYYRLEEEIGERDNVILEHVAEIGRLNDRIAELEYQLEDWTNNGWAEDYKARIAELERMEKTADENLLEAGMSVDLYFGSDTPDVMADTIMSLRDRIAELEMKIRHNALWQASEDAEERAHLEKLVPDLKKRIAELEEKQRWRVVANGELPEEEDEYWVWFDDKFTGIKISGYCDYSKQNGWDNTERVTHWMPLPEPPIVYGKVCEE